MGENLTNFRHQIGCKGHFSGGVALYLKTSFKETNYVVKFHTFSKSAQKDLRILARCILLGSRNECNSGTQEVKYPHIGGALCAELSHCSTWLLMEISNKLIFESSS